MIAAKRDEVEAQWEQRAEYLEANGVPARGSAIPGVSPIKIVFHSSRRRPASERRIFKYVVCAVLVAVGEGGKLKNP
jgi:hypothetical protein